MKAIRTISFYSSSLLLLVSLSSALSEPNNNTVIKNFDASGLRLENITMNVEIKTHSGSGMTAEVISQESPEEIVTLNLSNNELVIDQLRTVSAGNISVITHGGKGGARSVVSIGGETTIVEGNNVVVTQSGTYVKPRIKLNVPSGTPIILNNFKGKARIGNINGSFIMKGSGKVVAGNLKEVVLDIGKNSKVDISQVEQVLDVRASGNSKLNIQQGHVEKFDAHLSGNSRVTYDGHADKASIKVADNGKIFIASVDERPQQELSKNGRLTIGNW